LDIISDGNDMGVAKIIFKDGCHYNELLEVRCSYGMQCCGLLKITDVSEECTVSTIRVKE
jgi:hypothetical protein